MRALLATALVTALTGAASDARGQSLDDPRLHAMAQTVLADPAAVRRYVAFARAQPEKAGAPLLLLAGQYELGRGRFAAADRFFRQALAGAGEGPWRAPAESGLGWAALGRGDLAAARAHYGASARSDPAITIVTALLTAADGDASAAAPLAELARSAAPDLAELAWLALGYAYLWSGAGTEADAAFATVTSPALLDDATYARAHLELGGRGGEDARATLAALAELAPDVAARPSRALLALEPGAVLRAGLRRTRGKAILSEHAQLAAVLDGDGATLARAALRRFDGETPSAAPAAAGTGPGARQAAVPDAAAAPLVPASDRASRARPPAEAVSSWQPVRLGALALVVVLGTWWLRRRRLEPGIRRS